MAPRLEEGLLRQILRLVRAPRQSKQVAIDGGILLLDEAVPRLGITRADLLQPLRLAVQRPLRRSVGARAIFHVLPPCVHHGLVTAPAVPCLYL
jgi:hypothetical protein